MLRFIDQISQTHFKHASHLTPPAELTLLGLLFVFELPPPAPTWPPATAVPAAPILVCCLFLTAELPYELSHLIMLIFL